MTEGGVGRDCEVIVFYTVAIVATYKHNLKSGQMIQTLYLL